MNTKTETITETTETQLYVSSLKNLKSFYQFNGAYSGCITGTVTEDDIHNAIKHYDPSANLKNLNLVAIDYDTSVYFIALNMESANIQAYLKTPALKDAVLIFDDFNSTWRGCDYKDEVKPIYEFGTWFTNVQVSKFPPNNNSHGLRIIVDLINFRDISVETPTGHMVQWRMSTRFAQRLLSKLDKVADVNKLYELVNK